MRFLKRIWSDFEKGENVDLYITILVAIVLVILNLINIVPSNWLTPLNLTVLALICITLLGNRYRLETILSQTAHKGYELLHEYPPKLTQDILRSKELLIIGVDLSGDLKQSYAVLMEKLRRGDSVKILLVNPDSSACQVAAMLHFEPMSSNEKQSIVRRTLRICKELKKQTSGELEVRLTDCVPTFGGFLVNNDTSDSVLYLKLYRYRSYDGNKPILIFHSYDDYWYPFFKGEMITLWNDSTVWPDINS